jgi:hypothetical protein
MPWASDAAPDHKAIGERRVVMTAIRIYGENLRIAAHQQHILIADVTEQGFASEVILRDTLREVWTRG